MWTTANPGNLDRMAPKQKGGSAPKKHSVADEVEETLQAVVCCVVSCAGVGVGFLGHWKLT